MLARASRRARRLASLGVEPAPDSFRGLRRSPVPSLSLAPLRSPPASRCALPPSAPPDASSNRRVMRPCTMLRMSASGTAPIPAQSARHCLAHSAPQCPPLTRRGGSDPPGQPASISRSFIQHESGFRPPGAALGFTPHASMMQVCHGTPRRALSGTFADKRDPRIVGPSVYRTDTRESSSSCPRKSPPVPHRYTTGIRPDTG